MKKHRSAGRVKLILQTGPGENGAAALAMVLSYYKSPAAMEELTERPIASAADLVAQAQRRGIYAQGYQMTFEQLAQAPMPLIAHWQFRSFVVVTGIRSGKVWINSPEEGALCLSRRAFEEGFTGVAVCFAAPAEEPPGEEAGPRRGRARRSRGNALPAALAAAQALTAACCLVMAVLFRWAADRMSAPRSEGEGLLLWGLLLAALCQGAAAAVQGALLKNSGGKDRRLREERLRALLEGKTAAFFKGAAACRLELAARNGQAADAAAQAAVCRIQLISGGICLVLVGLQSAAAGIAAAVAAAGYWAFCRQSKWRVYSDLRLSARDRFLAADRAAGDLERGEELRLSRGTREGFRRWACLAGSARRPEAVLRQRRMWYFAAAVLLLAVLLVCLEEMVAGRAGGADLMGCLGLAGGAAAALGAAPGLVEAQMRLRCLEEDAQAVPPAEEEAPAPGGERDGALTLQNVTLRRAEDKEPLAKGVAFTVRRGEILTVAAPAEVRAALAPVAAGLERPRQGEVYLGNTALSALGERELCGSIRLLGGGVPFPRGTVRQNIAAGLPGITDCAVAEAAADALLHGSILLRRDGYDTPVSTLSSGERVLLEFACAFAGGTPFLVCDGLTGRLDPETEERLIRSLRRRGVGAVLLTEDLTLLRKGDLACRIDGGQVTLLERGELVDEEVYSLA